MYKLGTNIQISVYSFFGRTYPTQGHREPGAYRRDKPTYTHTQTL